MSPRRTLCLSWCAALISLGGCKLGVPIHVWQPPLLESTVGGRVAVSRIAGPREIAEPLQRKLIAVAPHDVGRETELIDASTLQDHTQIQLVSATDDQPNDLALASVARRQGIDYVLRGELLPKRHPPAGNETDPDEALTVSWRLTALAENRPAGGRPVSMNVESAIDRYPELALINETETLLTTAVARDTFRLITPWIDRQQVILSTPYFLMGSAKVRRGNAEALAGRWPQAEQIWTEVTEEHPTQIAAVHNLALAAVAAQDFTRAKQLARKAIRRQPTELHKNTLVWIEVMQRRYHRAFALPDPPEGWYVTGETP